MRDGQTRDRLICDALETDWLAGAAGFEPLHSELGFATTLSSGREDFEHAHLDNCISEKPIVVTGAQRPYNGLSTDGPINLLDAVKLACAPETRGKGAVVAFNGVPHTLHDALELPVGHEPISRGGQAPCGAKHSSAD